MKQIQPVFHGLRIRPPSLLFPVAQLVVSKKKHTEVGIPLCEGSCALAGSVALVMILYGASQWLNYDLFGLFVTWFKTVGEVGVFGGFVSLKSANMKGLEGWNFEIMVMLWNMSDFLLWRFMTFNSISSFVTWNIDVWNLFQTTSFSAYLRLQF